MVKYLPDTILKSMVLGNVVYTYAQSDTGALVELRGTLEKRGGAAVGTYEYDSTTTIVRRYRQDKTSDESPKLYTPLACASFAPRKSDTHNERHVFYVDDFNRIREYVYRSNSWTPGAIINLDIRVAAYSKLAAITVPNDLYNFITLYYQDPDKDAAIKTASYSGGTSQWIRNKPDLRDPPLYGTSLTAVAPRAGILVANPNSDDARQPVLYLQLDNLKLAHAQGGEPAEMPGFELDGKPMVFSPHTSLVALDNGSVLYIIYKSNNGSIKMIYVQVDKRMMTPTKLADGQAVDPTPNSYISAVLSPDKTEIVLFYQSLNTVTMKVDLYGLTLFKKTSASDSEWTHNNNPDKLED